MGSHYPLNGVDLDYKRYAHRALGGRDVIINRVVEDLLRPRCVTPRTYLRTGWYPHDVGPIKSENRELGLDMQVMWRLLTMECPRDVAVTLQQDITELIQLHYVERDPLIHQALKSFTFGDRSPRTAPGWKNDMIAHLALFEEARRLRHRFFVFSGNSQLTYNRGPSNGKLSLGPCFLAAPWSIRGPAWPRSLRKEARGSGYLTINKSKAIYHKPPTRSQSLPAHGRWGIVTSPPKYDPRKDGNYPPILFFPLKSLPELDKLSRRRSLSRSHIRAMFTDKPEWIVEDATSGDRLKHPCSNCAQYTHKTDHCLSNCGYCNSSEHRAPSCTLKATNRCKCRQFPQFHRASQCQVACSRRCGSPHPAGVYKHLNAMTCSHRCCMCGVRGHSGIKCALKMCPCGEQHLTQDCRWKVECSVKNCYFYLCRIHCKECGKKREKGAENAFVGRTCQACLRNGIPASARAP